MTSLREMQTECRQAFLAGDTHALSGMLRPRAGTADTGVHVYRNNVRETSRLALAAAYPVVEELVGAKCFAGLAAGYLKSHPSNEPDLQLFGERFPDFLDRCYSDSPHRYLTDVARLELATEQVLLEREPAPLDASRLAGVPVAELPEMRFIPSPAARLVRSDFPVLEIWRLHHHCSSAPVSLDAGPGHVLVLRSATDAVLRALSAPEYELADRLFKGQSIGRSFESMASVGGVVALQAALARLLTYGVFTDFH